MSAEQEYAMRQAGASPAEIAAYHNANIPGAQQPATQAPAQQQTTQQPAQQQQQYQQPQTPDWSNLESQYLTSARQNPGQIVWINNGTGETRYYVWDNGWNRQSNESSATDASQIAWLKGYYGNNVDGSVQGVNAGGNNIYYYKKDGVWTKANSQDEARTAADTFLISKGQQPRNNSQVAKDYLAGKTTQSQPNQTATNLLDPNGSGSVYNSTVDPTKGHYVYSKDKQSLVWFEPTAEQIASQKQTTQQPPVTDPTQQQPGTQPPAGAKTVEQIKSELAAQGLDVTGLSDDQVNVLGMMNQVIQKNAAQDKEIIPKQLTANELGAFLDKAKTELDPYYAERFDIYKKGLQDTVAYMTGDYEYQQSKNQNDLIAQQEATRKQAVEAGIARSGLRKKAEQQLLETNQGLVESQRRKQDYNVQQLGLEAEQKFGQPGANLFANPISGSQYNPLGIKTGEEQKAQEVALKQRQSELAQEEMNKRYATQLTQ